MDNKTTLDKEVEKEANRLEKEPYEDLAKQCDAEYRLAWAHQKPEKEEALLRLRLYNNQKRMKDAVGDTTMFSIFQTLLASLYIDRLSSHWKGREEGDDEVAENLNAMATYDYGDMQKDRTDFDWIWDTLFFSRGLCDLSEYLRDPDKNIFLPVPRIIDPLVFLRDPRAQSVNGNRMGRNAARFFGEEVKMSKEDIRNSPHAVSANIDFRSIKYGSGTQSLIADAQQAKNEAQGFQNDINRDESKLGVNGEYDITVWNTHWKVDGKVQKVKVWLANDRKLVVGFQKLGYDRWKLIDRPLYPTAHTWRGTSIPDLTEDKQRARAVAQNLGMKAMKADLYPMYIYDSNKIKNKNDLNFNFNKFIPADLPQGGSIGDAMMPLRKAFPNLPLLNFIYESLDVSAQKATAQSDIQQGVQATQDRTLGENNLVVSNGQNRNSLSARIFGWSEKDFWLTWYDCHKENFADKIDEKVIRLEGPFGPAWRKLTKDQITTERLDPDVEIESMQMSRARQLEERQSLGTYYALALQDPTANRRYALKDLGKVYGLSKEKLDRLFPPTIDERIAEDENLLLNDNKEIKVQLADDHLMHLEIHSKAAATAATYAHVESHKKALSMKKANPGIFPPDPNQPQIGPDGKPVNPMQTGATIPVQPSQSAGQPATTYSQ